MCDVTESVQMESGVNGRPAQNSQRPQLSLATDAADNLASMTMSASKVQEIASRWLLRLLSCGETLAETVRVNRRVRQR